MQSRLRTPAPLSTQSPQTQRMRLPRGAALGMVSTESFPAIIGTADAMIKSADVVLVGYEKTGGGHCTAIVRGGVADVRMAVEAGQQTAIQFGQFVSSSLIPRPLPNLEAVLPICARWDQFNVDPTDQGRRQRVGAIGLLETRGFPAMVGAADAMTKAAEIQLVSHETIGGGLCTIIIRGSLSNVAIAVEAGMHEAERIGELHAVMVIPRPMDDLTESLPQTEDAQAKAQPVRLPLALEEKQRERELVSLEPAKEDASAFPEMAPTPLEMPLEIPADAPPDQD